MSNELEKLTSGRFYTISELGVLFGMRPESARKKTIRIAKKENKRVQIKTYTERSDILTKYRLCNKPYTDEIECCDPARKSNISWFDIKRHGASLGNESFDLLCKLFEFKDDYIKFSELAKLTDVKTPKKNIFYLEHKGFVFHRRNRKSVREIKLIGFKPKKGSEKADTEQPSSMKLINEVFR